MANYKETAEFIRKYEGGFSNHPADKGGPTKWGVTLQTYRTLINKKATIFDLKEMTEAEWLLIYKKNYWDIWKADMITNQSLANMLVDWGWASGPKNVIKKVQTLLSLTADGIVGNKTLTALNAPGQENLFNRIKARRLNYVNSICVVDKTQKVFLNGWTNRINAIKFKP